ncbi:MAG: YfiR family protein [Phycisphaerae bacterium]|nr:YfiR family protein [Phycisphaerae bacterium]
MRINYISTILILIVFAANSAAKPALDPDHAKEYQIKAAFLYNFLNFVDWPPEKIQDSNEPIIIGIVDPADFKTAFEPIKDKTVNNRRIVIKDFKDLDEENFKDKNNPEWLATMAELKQCHILFFYECPPENTLNRILEELDGCGVLTVSHTAGFLEKNGNINFLLEDQKVRFEVNLISAKQNNLKLRSNLLKLAQRVISDQMK